MDDKNKKGLDRKFVACEEEYELNYIVEQLSKEFLSLNKTHIRETVKSICEDSNHPRGRDEFIIKVREKLRK